MKDFSTPRYRAFSRDKSSMQVFASNEIPVLWEMFSFLGTLLIRRPWKRSTSPLNGKEHEKISKIETIDVSM